jgi:hypothetical protein
MGNPAGRISLPRQGRCLRQTGMGGRFFVGHFAPLELFFRIAEFILEGISIQEGMV